jgi:hypothetical protein
MCCPDAPSPTKVIRRHQLDAAPTQQTRPVIACVVEGGHLITAFGLPASL